MSQGTETILLVEDEPVVRQVIGKILEMNGYQVLRAEHGRKALQIMARRPGPVHLLLTDVVMPDMGGRELVEKLAPGHPDLKVLYMSGYSEDAVVQHGVSGPGLAFVQKPFKNEELLVKVRQLLDTPLPRRDR